MNPHMPTLHAVSRNWTHWFSLAVIILSAAVQLKAVDLSGVYADGGTNVPTSSDQAKGESSLHALLRLEFDAKVASVLREQTSQVKIKHESGLLDIEVYDVNESISWSARWVEGRDYLIQGERLIARLKAAHLGADEIILTLERLPNYGLLQVSTQRVSPTVLGPAARKLGTALFYSMP